MATCTWIANRIYIRNIGDCIDNVITNCEALKKDLSEDSTEYELEVFFFM